MRKDITKPMTYEPSNAPVWTQAEPDDPASMPEDIRMELHPNGSCMRIRVDKCSRIADDAYRAVMTKPVDGRTEDIHLLIKAESIEDACQQAVSAFLSHAAQACTDAIALHEALLAYRLAYVLPGQTPVVTERLEPSVNLPSEASVPVANLIDRLAKLCATNTARISDPVWELLPNGAGIRNFTLGTARLAGPELLEAARMRLADLETIRMIATGQDAETDEERT